MKKRHVKEAVVVASLFSRKRKAANLTYFCPPELLIHEERRARPTIRHGERTPLLSSLLLSSLSLLSTYRCNKVTCAQQLLCKKEPNTPKKEASIPPPSHTSHRTTRLSWLLRADPTFASPGRTQPSWEPVTGRAKSRGSNKK